MRAVFQIRSLEQRHRSRDASDTEIYCVTGAKIGQLSVWYWQRRPVRFAESGQFELTSHQVFGQSENLIKLAPSHIDSAFRETPFHALCTSFSAMNRQNLARTKSERQTRKIVIILRLPLVVVNSIVLVHDSWCRPFSLSSLSEMDSVRVINQNVRSHSRSDLSFAIGSRRAIDREFRSRV